MCFFLRVIDNTLIVREGRNFCKITILEDCSIKYKVLHNLEKMLKGDFMANQDFIVSKQGERLMFLNLHKNYDLSEVFLSKKVVDICLCEDNLILLHNAAITMYNLHKRTTIEHQLMLQRKPISIQANAHAVAVLDAINDVHIFSLPGTGIYFYLNTLNIYP